MVCCYCMLLLCVVIVCYCVLLLYVPNIGRWVRLKSCALCCVLQVDFVVADRNRLQCLVKSLKHGVIRMR